MIVNRIPTVSTWSLLSALAGLHVVWATGASFPFKDRATLADATAGADTAPGAPDCLAVAGVLGIAAALVADRLPIGARLRRVGVAGVAMVLTVRGALGLLGQTHRVVPWTPNEHFRGLDRRYYGPLCLALAGGAAISARGTKSGFV